MYLTKTVLNGGDLPSLLPETVKQEIHGNLQKFKYMSKSPSNPIGSASNYGSIGNPSGVQFQINSPSLSPPSSNLGSYQITPPPPPPLSIPSNISRSSSSTSLEFKSKPVWTITPEEKQRYDQIFKTWDAGNTGFISGEKAISIFTQSGLHENILAHIW